MAEITKQDIKEIFIEALEPLARSVQEDFKKVHKRFDGVESRIDKVEIRLGTVESRLDAVESDVRWMKENTYELLTKLDKFITLYEEQRMEILSLNMQVRRLEERINQLEAQQKKVSS